MHEQHVREVGGDAAERGRAEPVGLVPVADREQRLDRCSATSTALSIPYRRITSSPACPSRADSPGRPSIVSTSVKLTYAALQAEVIADLLGELQGLTEVGEALLAAAEVGEVAAEHGERPDLCLACADLPSERERLLGDRQRLRVAPGHHQPARERPQRVRALRRGRLRRHELDRALERGESSVVLPVSWRYSPRRTWRSAARCGSSAPTSSIARRRELDRARGGADVARRARPPRSRARRGRARRARPRPARRPRARAPARDAREPPPGRRRPPPGGPPRPRRRAPPSRRPAAAQCGASSAGPAAPLRGELVGEPRVQLLALAGEDGRVDRLRQQRVAEAEAARRLRRRRGRRARPPGAATRAPRAPAGRTAARSSGYPTSRPAAAATRNRLCVGWSRRATRCSSRSRRPRGSSPLVAAGGEELLGEEGVALRAGDDRVRQRRRQRMRRRERRAAPPALALERAELEHERRARAPDAVGEPAHALGRRGLVGAVGREQQHRPVGEVVREEDDEVERRGVGPVQILEHEQHGCRRCPVGEQRQRLLEHAAAASRRLPVDVPRLPERTQRLDERLVRQLRADEIDRAPDEDLEPRGAGAPSPSSDASRVLPMPASPATRTVAPFPARAASSARSSSSSSRTRPTNTSLARASIPASIAQPPPGGRA